MSDTKKAKKKKFLRENTVWMNSHVPERTAVAFCCYPKHKGYMSAHLVDKHQCIRKKCPHLKKYVHRYWADKAAIKILKKQKKNGITTVIIDDVEFKSTDKNLIASRFLDRWLERNQNGKGMPEIKQGIIL
jgi:hypothetical protein